MKWATIKMVISLVVQHCWRIKHLDIKTTFFNGDLEEDVFMLQPHGFVKEGSEDLVYKLNHVLYGLKQALCAWCNKINSFLKEQGMTRNELDHNLYSLIENERCVIIILYVDDMMFVGDHTLKLLFLEEQLEKRFEMSKLGIMKLYIGMEFNYFPFGIFLCQKNYAQLIFERFGMENCNPMSTLIQDGLQL